ncbi:MAG: glycosyl hydrolase family 28 protein [Kiritimatiellia bacterium]
MHSIKRNETSDSAWVSANDFADAADDAEMIQRAIDDAVRSGVRTARVPSMNARTGASVWTLSRTLLLPSHVTLVLDHAHLRMADGVICQMMRNSNALTPEGNSPAGRQRGIRIIGIGEAVLDGGEPNGLSEFTSDKDGFPHISENLTIYLHNVEDFTIENLRIVDQRWWAIALMYCEHGRIERIRFELTRHALDSRAPWRNQDGIDLRVGCAHIGIRGISGETGDDLIALTALKSEHFEVKQRVDGLSTDIHDIAIEDVRGVTNMCAIIRLLNHFGHRIYNVVMRDIFEISRPGFENKTQMAIRIGDTCTVYYRNDPECRLRHGEIFNIHIENLFTRALTAIITCGSIKNLTARNIHLLEDGQHVYVCGGFDVDHQPFIFLPSRQDEIDACRLKSSRCPTIAENVLFENVYVTASGPVSASGGARFRFRECDLRNVAVRNVCADEDLPLVEFSGDCKGTVEGLE